MIELNIEHLRALLEKATPEPWSWEAEPDAIWPEATLYAGRDSRHHGANLFGRLELDVNGVSNLDLIVEAINALPALLDEIERLQAHNESLWVRLAEARSFAADADRLSEVLGAVRALPNEFEANARKVRDGCAGSRPWAKGKATGLRHAAILLEAKLKEAGDE